MQKAIERNSPVRSAGGIFKVWVGSDDVTAPDGINAPR